MVSASYNRSASDQTDHKVYLDLTLFWEILESSLISESSDQNGIQLGTSLKSQTKSSATTDEVDAYLLPEPNRLDTSISTPNTTHENSSSADQVVQNMSHPDLLNSSHDDFAVLAQSFFAQGQDFVGSMDDWWVLDQN